MRNHIQHNLNKCDYVFIFISENYKSSGICMNEIFGSGSVWGGGEDSLFEADIHKSGLKLYEYPAVIATVDYGNGSNWFTGYSEK